MKCLQKLPPSTRQPFRPLTAGCTKARLREVLPGLRGEAGGAGGACLGMGRGWACSASLLLLTVWDQVGGCGRGAGAPR